MNLAPHPAKFTDTILDFAEPYMREHGGLWLDPFAGTGKIHLLAERTGCQTIGVEIEEEWALYHERTICGDSLALLLLFRKRLFDGIFTSPTYGNRMADKHNARDASKRHTYKHYLGRDLHPNNTGGMQWGPVYRNLNRGVAEQCWWVLKPGGKVLWNVSNHIRKGVEIDVVSWHQDMLKSIGFECATRLLIPTPRQRHGENRDARVEYEVLLIGNKPEGALT